MTVYIPNSKKTYKIEVLDKNNQILKSFNTKTDAMKYLGVSYIPKITDEKPKYMKKIDKSIRVKLPKF